MAAHANSVPNNNTDSTSDCIIKELYRQQDDCSCPPGPKENGETPGLNGTNGTKGEKGDPGPHGERGVEKES